MARCALNRTTPRIDSPDSAKNDNLPALPVDSPELRTRMKELLDIVLVYCTKEVEADPLWDVEEENKGDDD